MTRMLLALLAFYRKWLSPALHALGTGGCKFLPTCSEYATVVIATHGPLRGSWLALLRLLRCHPFSPGGFDPAPPAYGRHAHAVRKTDSPQATSFPHEPLP